MVGDLLKNMTENDRELSGLTSATHIKQKFLVIHSTIDDDYDDYDLKLNDSDEGGNWKKKFSFLSLFTLTLRLIVWV